MANNPNEARADNFFEQILRFPSFVPTEMGLAGPDGGLAETTAAAGAPMMMLQLNSIDGAGHLRAIGGGGVGAFHGQIFPLELSLEQGKDGFLKPEEASGSGKCFRDQVFRGQPIPATVAGAPHPPVMCPRVRIRGVQATDPHSIAEHLRGERIAERIRALQELVPSVNKIDRAAMLDEIVDHLKFLSLQVRVLSMNRLGGAGAVAPLVSDTPLSSDEE